MNYTSVSELTDPDHFLPRLLGASTGALVAMNFFSAPYSFIFLALPAALSVLLLVQILRDDDQRKKFTGAVLKPGIWPLALSLVVLSMVYGMFRTEGSINPTTLIELVVGLCCIGFSFVATTIIDSEIRRDTVIEYMAWTVAVVLLPASFLSMYKYAYLIAGYRMDIIPAHRHGDYPWGTSLRQDYNLYAIPFISAVIFIVSDTFQRYRGAFWLLTGAVVVSVAIYCG